MHLKMPPYKVLYSSLKYAGFFQILGFYDASDLTQVNFNGNAKNQFQLLQQIFLDVYAKI